MFKSYSSIKMKEIWTRWKGGSRGCGWMDVFIHRADS